MIDVKKKSFLGLLLISLLLPQSSFSAVTVPTGTGVQPRTIGSNSSRNVTNNYSPKANNRLITKFLNPVAAEPTGRNWEQIFPKIKQLLAAIRERLLNAIIVTGETNSPPVAETQDLETTTNLPIEITLSGSDADTGDILSYQIALEPVNGTLSGTPPVITYTANDGFSGQDSFLFTVNDDSVISDPALVTIDVIKENSPPVANALPANTAPSTPLIITLSGSDPDNDPLTFELTGDGPTNGSLAQDGDGPIVTYTPNMGFIGHDSFGYIVNDGQLDSAEARVDITIELSLMEDRLNPLEVDEFDDFGWAVDISGSRAIVSALNYWGENDEYGLAYLYSYDGNVWKKQAEFFPVAERGLEHFYTPGGFGYSVAIEGDVAVVGDPWGGVEWEDNNGWEVNDNGLVYVFNYRPGWGWTLDEVLRPDDNINDSSDVQFGTSVDITRKPDGGYRIVVGAPWQEGGGAVYSFESSGGSGWTNKRIIHATEADPNSNIADQFGTDVAVDGTNVLINAPYHNNFPATQEYGAAYIFEDGGPGVDWEYKAKFASLDSLTYGNFGSSLSLSGDVAVISASGLDSAYILKKTNGIWQTTPVQVLTGISRSDFGTSVAVENGTVMVGVPMEFAIDADDNLFPDDDYMGAVYIFEPNADLTNWIEVKRVSPEIGNRTINDMFGRSVAASEDRFIVGVDFQWVTCPGGEEEGCTFYDPNFGSAYIYAPPTTRIIFRADKETVPPEDNLTLSWTTIDADDGTINIVADDGTPIVENGPVSGSITIPIPLTDLNTVKTYTATASGPKGLSNPAVIDITVSYPQPTIAFAVSPGPDPTDPSANAILTWITTNADPSINGTVVIDQGIGSVTASGSMPVTVANDTTYTITATNPSYTDENAVIAHVEVVLPTNLVLTNNPATIAGNDVTISWEPNGTATALYLQELDGSGNLLLETLIATDPFNTTSYTFTPNSTSTYRLRFSTDSGSIFQDITITILDPASLGIAILTPPIGGTINKPFTNVTGLVTTGEDEIGVIVNGVIAIVDGNEFFANNVPLNEGPNTLEAIATESNGAYVSSFIEVVVDTSTGEWIILGLDPETGAIDIGSTPLVPFTTTLKADLYLLNVATSSSVDCSLNGGGACPGFIATQVSGNITEYDLSFSNSGVYRIEYSVNTGQYTQDIMIEVLEKEALDNFLKGRWEGMKAELALKKVDSATSYFTSSTIGLYTDVFNELYNELPGIVGEMDTAGIQLVSVTDDRVTYRINRDETHDGQTYPISYHIYFIKEMGVWKIYKF